MALRNIGSFEFRPSQLGIARFTAPVPVEQVLSAYPKAQMAAAAPMFGHTASRSCGGGIVPCTRLLDTRYGVNFPSKFPDSGVTISVVNGIASAQQGAAVAPGATVAVQGYPTIVWNGRAAGPGTVESSVAGLGLLRNGNLLYLVASGGSPKDLGNEFVRRSAMAASYCDAGSSAGLIIRDEGWQGAHARNPQLPGWIISEGNAVSRPGLSPLAKAGIILTLIAAAGGAAYWYYSTLPPAYAQVPKTFNRSGTASARRYR